MLVYYVKCDFKDCNERLEPAPRHTSEFLKLGWTVFLKNQHYFEVGNEIHFCPFHSGVSGMSELMKKE